MIWKRWRRVNDQEKKVCFIIYRTYKTRDVRDVRDVREA
uniref:Uncharacterized protein n=1 Tax=viral metagenome TaxID=1070528 RepID=A0A6C0EWZ7_9ZZZZ